MSNIKTMVGAWVVSMRPHTLTAGISPVMVGCALAYHAGGFSWIPALLCLGVAVLAQVASNFANDYYDFKKGADGPNRLGKSRGLQQGLISPQALLKATIATLGAACLCGLGLLFYGPWWLLLVGVAIALAVLGYSAGPFPLSYNGLGDVSVLIFYGIIPVTFTYYVQTGSFSSLTLVFAFALGLVATNILIVNNYRDYEEDKVSGKRTTIVRFGRKCGRWMYSLNGFAAHLLLIPYLYKAEVSIFIWILFVLMSLLFMRLRKAFLTTDGTALNKVLGQTALFVFLYAIIQSIILLHTAQA